MIDRTNVYYIETIRNIDDALKELSRLTDNESIINYKDSIMHYLVVLAHSVGDLYSRLDVKTVNNNNIINAFMYLNNQIKHDKELNFVSCFMAGSEYPRFYPRSYVKAHSCWADFEDHECRGIRLRPQYEMYLMNRDIKESLEVLKNEINKIVI